MPHSPSSPPEPKDRPSFGTIYRDHFPRVRWLVRRSGVPDRDIEDVIQNIFLAIHRSLPRFDWSRRLQPWVDTISVRTARDYRRIKMNGEKLSDSEAFDPADPASHDREGRFASRRDALKELDTILQSLDEDERELLVLCDLDERRASDIAEAHNLPLGTVSTRIRRARKSFDEAVHRRRLAEERRLGGVHALPLFLLTPTALWKAARAAPDVSLAAQAQGWGRLVRATATNRVTRALASWVGLAPANLVGTVVLAATMGALGGAGIHAALSPARDVGPAYTSGERQAWATSATPPPLAMIQGAAATPVDSVTARTSPTSPGHSARAGLDPLAAERAEMALLDSARSALRNHQPEGALLEIERHASQFPQGAYKAERESLRREAKRALAAHPDVPPHDQ